MARASEDRIAGELLDVRSAAAWLGVTERALRRRIERHAVPHRRWGARVVLLRRDLEAWLAQLSGVDVAEAVARARGEAAR